MITTLASSLNSSESFLARFGLVASCSCGGAWKKRGAPDSYAREGRLICLFSSAVCSLT